MVYLVEARTDQGELLSLPLGDFSNGFVVQDITGLDPVKANVVSSSFATQDGEQFQSSRREKRNIVVTLGLEPDFSVKTVRQLRNQLMNIFMPKSEVTLRFYTVNEATVDITGTVESMDAPLFTDKPTATISILCFDPDFKDISNVYFAGTSSPDFVENARQYDGTIESGLLINVHLQQDVGNFSIYNKSANNVEQSMNFAAPMKAGDWIQISTAPGSKGVSINRGGAWSSFLYALSPYSTWLEFFPGLNRLRVTVPGGGVPYDVAYVTKYGGL